MLNLSLNGILLILIKFRFLNNFKINKYQVLYIAKYCTNADNLVQSLLKDIEEIILLSYTL